MNLRSGTPYWTDVDNEPAVYPPLAADAQCQVLVLGGGVTGALAAYRLAMEGVDVLLVDGREFGLGSTAASTGLLQYEVDTPLIDLIEQVGRPHALHAYRRGLTAIDEIERLVAELGDPCGFARRDSLYFASSIWHYRALQREFECRRDAGFDVSFLSREELAEVSTIQAAGAIRSRGDAQIDPLRFTRRLIAAATRRGLRAYANTKIDDIAEGVDGVVARTPFAAIRAQAIVYASGYQTEQHLAETKGQLDSTYAVASGPHLEVPGWPDECLLWETARPYFYARRTADGRVLLGGEDTEFANDHDRDALLDRKTARLLARFSQLFPGVEISAEYAWAGTFAATKDGLAYIGQPADRPRAYYALGYGGNGITFGMIAARLIVDLYAGRPNADAAVFRFGR